MTTPTAGDGEETQQQRALRAIQAIANGANATEEAIRLSNDFTDRQTTRLVTWLKRHRRR